MTPHLAETLLSRRRFLREAGIAIAIAALPQCARAQQISDAAIDGYRVLRARPGSARLRGVDKSATPILGYDGLTPGPLLRVKRGEEIRVRLVNELSEATTVHWHGLRLPNAMDGVAHLTQPPIAPGASFDYRFTAPDAGTFWYHAHLNSAAQLDRGLYGALIIDEPEPVDVDRDVVLVLDDWRLNADGTIDEVSFGAMHDAATAGRLGNFFTCNGAAAPDIAVKAGERVRLRLINAANARVLALRLDRHQATVMAFDGQPAEPFVARDARIGLGPGNRADLFVDATLDPGASAPLMLETENGPVAIARLAYDAAASTRTAPRTAPPPLPANPLPARMDFVGALKLDVPLDGGMMGMMGGMRGGMMGGAPMGPGGRTRNGVGGAAIWTMAGRAADGHSGPALLSVKRGRTVMLAFANRTAFAHAMHLHGHHFRLLDRMDDGWKPFWLDTLVVPPQETWRIAFVADNPGKWMIHCHMLEHQETGMAAWFEVT